MKYIIGYSFFLTLVGSGQMEWQPIGSALLTRWGRSMNLEQTWREHPRPQLQRERWTNLNGLWDFAILPKQEGEVDSKQLFSVATGVKKISGSSQILVPFCPESSLSGVGSLIQPGQSVWYRRSLPIKAVVGKRTLLHFDAADYETTVWVNEHEVGKHVGGNTSFTFDITKYLTIRENHVTVRVNDATEGYQLNGKQALNPAAITYTRVSGIWQTVWLEEVPERSISDLEFETRVVQEQIKSTVGADGVKTEEVEDKTFLEVRPKLDGPSIFEESVKVSVSFAGKEVVSGSGNDKLRFEMANPQWWTPEHPNLYNLRVELLDGTGKVVDTVQSYTALRTVGKVRGTGGCLQIALNGKETFLFGPLDQGWWPDGLLTPPSDEAMVADLQFIKDAGFNMVRKHVKVENDRFYYWCDKLGLAVWQDQVSAGVGGDASTAGVSPQWTFMQPNPKDAVWPEKEKQQWITEYKEMVDHLRDHPSILIWSLFNEAWGQHDSMELGKMAKEYDPTRLVCIASGGNFWPVGDIASNHHYTEPDFPFADPRLQDFIKVCGEMGGFGMAVEGHLFNPEKRKWGYGGKTTPLNEWKQSYNVTVNQLAQLRQQGLSAGVYTQTSDVENEVNGLLTYDRVPKVDAKWLKAINDRVIKGGKQIRRPNDVGMPKSSP